MSAITVSDKNDSAVNSKSSLYFGVGSSSGNGIYEVTLNYDTGHFCSCKGMLAKIRKFGGIGTLSKRDNQHWCKHINAVRSHAAFEIRLQAREMRNIAFGVHETPIDPETGRNMNFPLSRSKSEPIQLPVPTSGRRAAIAATRAKQGSPDPEEAKRRLAEIEAERVALLAEIEAQQTKRNQARKVLAALVSEHGAEELAALLAEVA